MKPASFAIGTLLLAVIIPTCALAAFRSIDRQNVNMVNSFTF